LSKKPSSEKAIALLKGGNQRFVDGKTMPPHIDAALPAQAGSDEQGDHTRLPLVSREKEMY
jgi:carbonic anhydrase